MPPPPAARAKLLDAFAQILVEQGERAATLEAVAAHAGVSKGGLLYHFGSKDALVQGLVDRLDGEVERDLAAMASAEDGAAAYYVRTSVFADTPLDRAIVAVMTLSQGSNPIAQQSLRSVQERWLATLRTQIPDESVARAVMLIGDGLYYNAALSGGERSVTDDQLAELLDRIEYLIGYSKSDR